MFKNVNVGDRVRLTGHGEVHEFTVTRTGGGYISSTHNRFEDDLEGWTVDILAPTEPTTNGTLVTLFDQSIGYERTIVRVGNRWIDIAVSGQYAWDTWMSDAKPGSVKVVYVHE